MRVRLSALAPVLALLGLTLALTVIWDRFVPREDHVTGIFFTAQNLGNVLRQNAEYGILAVGMTFVILTAGIDLSLGSLLAFRSVVAAGVIDTHPHSRPR